MSAEHAGRLARAQAAMGGAGLDALLLTTEADIRWATGFLTRFWESPTRPWFLVVPARGASVAVIPSIGVPLMEAAAVGEVRSWASPDPADDGVSLLAGTLADLVPSGGQIGVPSGGGTHLRMPLADWDRLRAALPDRRFGSDGGAMERLRMMKSEAEIALIRETCAVAGRAFARLPEIARAGAALPEVFRRFQMLLLEEGADWVPYLAGAAGPGGYGDVIAPATDRALSRGDVLMLDTGAIRAGAFCDFDRNFAVGAPSGEGAEAHARLVEATRAGLAAARPGATAADLFEAMARVTGAGAGAGRLGHGLGLQLTEPPSLIPADRTVFAPGMVLTLEPSLRLGDGRLMVHEEDVVIREDGAEWLTDPAGPEMPVLAG